MTSYINQIKLFVKNLKKFIEFIFKFSMENCEIISN